MKPIAIVLVVLIFITTIAAFILSRNILDDFKEVSERMQSDTRVYDDDNASAINNFEEHYAQDTGQAALLLADAKKAVSLADDFVQRVQALKNLIIERSGGYVDNDSTGDYAGKRNYKIPAELLVEGEHGRDLKVAIVALRDSLLAVPTLTAEDRAQLTNEMTLSVAYNIEAAKKLGKKSWEEYLFGHVPVVAVLTILTKFQRDAKKSAGLVVETLFKKMEGSPHS